MRKAALLVNNEYDQVERPVRKSRGKAVNDDHSGTYVGKSKAAKVASMNKLHLILKDVKPLNEPQRQMMEAYDNGMSIVAQGSAGVGKSWLACYLALRDLLNGDIDNVTIIRSAVPTRDIGALPGSLLEKIDVYAAPYKDIVCDLLGSGTAWDSLTKSGAVSFCCTSFLRGLTFKNCVIIVDEAQSQSFHEIGTIMQRVGNNCRVILSGDTRQCDFVGKKEISGFTDAVKVASKMPKYFDIVTFNKNHCVRSDFVRCWLSETEDANL